MTQFKVHKILIHKWLKKWIKFFKTLKNPAILYEIVKSQSKSMDFTYLGFLDLSRWRGRKSQNPIF